MQGRNFLYLRFQHNQDPANLLQQKGARALPLYKAAKTEGGLLLNVVYGRGIFKDGRKFQRPQVGIFLPCYSTIQRSKHGLVHGSFRQLNSFSFLNAGPRGIVPFLVPAECFKAGSCSGVRAKLKLLASELLGFLEDIDLGTYLESRS